MSPWRPWLPILARKIMTRDKEEKEAVSQKMTPVIRIQLQRLPLMMVLIIVKVTLEVTVICHQGPLRLLKARVMKRRNRNRLLVDLKKSFWTLLLLG